MMTRFLQEGQVTFVANNTGHKLSSAVLSPYNSNLFCHEVDEIRFQMVITETKIEYRNYQYDSPRAGLKSVTTKWLRQILGEIIRDYSYITTVHNPYHFTISVPALESVSQAYNLNQRASKLDYNRNKT
ncbi:hypothetical protein VNO77_01281 [Canavalia gladiata]|uniref:Uncharacterized protein n=1 Tax=Canavalia gladiata TaxID=3824 RepID=A0AAN9MRL6_CANGL